MSDVVVAGGLGGGNQTPQASILKLMKISAYINRSIQHTNQLAHTRWGHLLDGSKKGLGEKTVVEKKCFVGAMEKKRVCSGGKNISSFNFLRSGTHCHKQA
jgi:hypothetical protein